MPNSEPWNESDLCEVVRILGQVAVMPEDPGGRRQYLMDALAELIAADAWVWAVSPLMIAGSQPVYLYQHTRGWEPERWTRFLLAVEHEDTGAMTAPLAEAMVHAEGQVTRYLSQIVSEERFAQSPAHTLWRNAGVGTLMITLHPMSGQGTSCIGFYRPIGAPEFTERERRIAHVVLREVPFLHEAGLPHRETRSLPTLPPRCRLVINQLVRGLSRQQIASQLGLGASTVDTYIKRIFKHFGVHSQSELIARLCRCDDREH